MRNKTSMLALENESPGTGQESGLIPVDFQIGHLPDSYFVPWGVQAHFFLAFGFEYLIGRRCFTRCLHDRGLEWACPGLQKANGKSLFQA
jgi:hypothetical protein